MSHSSFSQQHGTKAMASQITNQGEERIIVHEGELPHYFPPGHTKTVNVRLVEASFNGVFELIHGTLGPGAEVEAHQHELEYQVFYIVSGTARFTLGANLPAICGAGSVIRIPPRMVHQISNIGGDPLELIIVYSPPLPRSGDRA